MGDGIEFYRPVGEPSFLGSAQADPQTQTTPQCRLPSFDFDPTQPFAPFSNYRPADSIPFFRHSFQYQCSQLPSISCQGVFGVREKSEANIAVLANGEDSFSARIEALRSAKRSIRIQALIFTGDESGLLVAEILKQKKHENPNLDIRIIVDAASTASSWQTQWMLYDLKQNGIEVEGYEALWLQWINEYSIKEPMNVNRRFHEKLWIIDGEEKDGVAIVGGLNIANEYFRVDSRPRNRWRDQDVVVKGSILQDLSATFDRNYRYFKEVKNKHPDIFNTDKYWDQWRREIVGRFGTLRIPFRSDPRITAHVQELARRPVLTNLEFVPAKARFIQNRPRYQESYISQAYLTLIRSARERIEIANAYFIPTRSVREALIAAAKRGVTIRIVTNSKGTNDLPQMTVVGRYFYKELLAASPNIQIYEWEGNWHAEGTLHAKYAVFDGQVAIVGSYNLDPRSELHNSESVIAFEEPRLAAKLSNLFRIDLSKSRKIGIKEAARFVLPQNPLEFLELQSSLWLRDWL